MVEISIFEETENENTTETEEIIDEREMDIYLWKDRDGT